MVSNMTHDHTIKLLCSYVRGESFIFDDPVSCMYSGSSATHCRECVK